MYDKFKLALPALILTLIITITSALTINIIAPTNNTNYTTNSLALNFTTDATTNTTCILQLNEINTTQTDCANTTIAANQGQNTLVIYATDADSNYTSQQTTFYVDSNAPQVNTSLQDLKTTSATIIISSNEAANTTLTYWTNTTNATIQNTNYTNQTNLNLTNLNPNTTYSYNLTNCDELNNCNTTTNNFNTNTLPAVTFNTPNPNANTTGVITLNATADDDTNVTLLSFTLSNQTWNTTLNTTNTQNYWTAQLNTTLLTDGQYNLTATATDTQNEQNTTTTTIKTDNTKPALQLFNYTNNTKIKTTTITLNYTATDYTLDKCWYVLDIQNVNIPNCQNTTISSLTETTHTITLYVNDSTNQTNSIQLNFTIDATNPVISNFDFDRVNTNVNLTWTTNEPTNYTIRFGSNQTYESTRTNPNLTNTFNIQLTEMEYAKTYNFNLTACDEANNCANATLTMAMPNAPTTQTQTTAASGGAAASAPAEPTALRAAPLAAETASQTLTNTLVQENTTITTNELSNQTNTNAPSQITAFATAQDKDNFAIGLALLSGLSILMYGYKRPLLKRVKSKTTKKNKRAKKEEPTEKPKNRYAYLEQVNGKKVHFPIEHKPHHTNQHVQKVKFKNGSLADQLAHAIKKRI